MAADMTPVGYKDVEVCHKNTNCTVTGTPPAWLYHTEGTFYRQCGGAYYGKRRLIDVCTLLVSCRADSSYITKYGILGRVWHTLPAFAL